MNPDIARRFDTEFTPRIVDQIADLLGPHVHVVAQPHGGPGHPSQVGIVGTARARAHGFAYPLNVAMTWDTGEIERLVASDDAARFTRYLAALPHKLPGWESARGIDFGARAQTEPFVLLGGLDFEA